MKILHDQTNVNSKILFQRYLQADTKKFQFWWKSTNLNMQTSVKLPNPDQ